MKRLHEENINTPAHLDWVWEQPAMHRYDSVRHESLLKFVKPQEKVLELGAGRCSAIEYGLLVKNLDMDAHAIDYSKVAVEMTRSICPKLTYIQGDIFTNPYKDGEFDGVICAEVIEHLEEPYTLAQEMSRLVKLGGWITISTVDETCVDAIKHGDYPEHLWAFTQDDLKELFEPYFAHIEVGFCGNYRMIWGRK